MSWGAVAGSVVGGLFGGGSDKNGGAGASTQTKEPWEASAPWLKNLLSQGETLSDAYLANPTSPLQQTAYNNSYGVSDALRQATPGLLSQFSGQQTGFDKNNPTAKPKAFDLSLLSSGLAGNQQSLLGSNLVSSSAQIPPVAPTAEVAAPQDDEFMAKLKRLFSDPDLTKN